uniref:BTB domain-containing protein n=1 Tax=Panagrolaimus davidi TaxID=227884 RepID=A0A914QPD7_9BILA
MLIKFDFVKRTKLSADTTLINLLQDVELTVVYRGKFEDGYHSYKIENPKLDFEITKISYKKYFGDKEYDITNKYDKSKKTFVTYFPPDSSTENKYLYTFYISANIQLDPDRFAIYQLRIPANKFESLELHNFIEAEIILPDHYNLEFTYYVKKISPSKIELFIVNPYDVEIEGNNGHFSAEYESKKDIDVEILFVFGQSYLNTKKIGISPQTANDESRPQSRLGSPIPFQLPNELKLSNDIFPDAFLIASDKTKIPCHRCILAKFSNVFVELLNTISNLPAIINVEEFNAQTIQSALEFLYGKIDSIKGKENEIFKFAVKYNIKMLIDACCKYFEESVNPSNVCELIQIAYLHDFEELKQKFSKVLVEKKKEIDAKKIADLPKNILVEFLTLLNL